MKARREIYFHVGLGKVASTFLQKQVFPRLVGTRYIKSGLYKKSKQLISRLKVNRFLVSREFDRQLEREVRWFSKDFPEARCIIVFRRHEEWIASQYRRHVKNGWHGTFDQFIDLENDEGFWKQKDLFFYPMLKVIESNFHDKPLVLFYDDLVHRPDQFIQALALYTKTSVSGNVSLKPVHTSFSDKQLLFLRMFCRRFMRRVPKGYSNRLKNWLLFRPVWALYHAILYISSLFPEKWVRNECLIPEESIQKVRAFYERDWGLVQEYAVKNNLYAG